VIGAGGEPRQRGRHFKAPVYARRRLPALASWVAVAVGSAVRVEQFMTRRSLWLDEALVSMNVVQRGFGGLTRPLDYAQAAPIGWLWAQRAAVTILGVNEYSLRLLPLLAGLASLLLVGYLAERLIGPWAAVAATWLLALSPSAVRYSAEVKQYSSDMAVALILLVLATAMSRRPRPGAQLLVVWALIGAAAIWMSHPAVLVLGAETAVLATAYLLRRAWRDAVRLAMASAVWLAALLGEWLVSLRDLRSNQFLTAVWATGLAPHGVGLGGLVRWAGRVLTATAADPGRWTPGLVGAVAVAAGAAAIAVGLHRPMAAALIVAPLGTAFGAAALRLYPLKGRLALYLVPLGALCLGALVETAVRTAGRRPLSSYRPPVVLAVAGGVASVALAVGPALAVGRVARQPLTIAEIRPVMQRVHRQLRPGDDVVVLALATQPARFYADTTGVIPTRALADGLIGSPCGGAPLTRSSFAGRVWVLFAYRASASPADEQPAVVARLATMAHLVIVDQEPGASAYLFDFSRPADDPTGRSARTHTSLACLDLEAVQPPPTSTLTSGPFHSGVRFVRRVASAAPSRSKAGPPQRVGPRP
jgi:4-amino-4-deoxy-L-arabinose transferase-like glycosyltransferase